MSSSHKGSLMQLNNIVLPVDGNTVFLAHYDITERCVLTGLQPTQNVTTLRQREGKFGGGIAIEENTTNIVKNGGIKSDTLNRNYSVAWDSSLNGSIYASNWGTGYNGGVPNPTVGYHAHFNESIFGYPVLELIDKNSQFSDATYNLKHRWTGISQQLTSNVSTLGWADGVQVSISFDMMVDHVDKGVNLGLYHKNNGNTAYTFAGASTTHYCTKAYEWQRKTITYTLKTADWDFTQPCNLYIYGHYYRNDYEGVGWVKDIQVETKGFSTSFIDSTRSTGSLSYPLNIDPNIFTVNFWAKSVDSSSGFYFEFIAPDGSNRVFFRPSSATALGGGRVVGGTTNYIGDGPISNIQEWNMYTLTSNGTNMKMFFNGVKISSNSIPVLSGVSNSMNINVGNGVRNVIIDELRVDRIERTEEEIMSWCLSDNPFAPKGIYRLAY